MWQLIETAQKDGTPVLVCEGDYIDVAQNFHDVVDYPDERTDQWFARESSQVSCKPTHWMPLPEPPKVTDGASPPQAQV